MSVLVLAAAARSEPTLTPQPRAGRYGDASWPAREPNPPHPILRGQGEYAHMKQDPGPLRNLWTDLLPRSLTLEQRAQRVECALGLHREWVAPEQLAAADQQVDDRATSDKPATRSKTV